MAVSQFPGLLNKRRVSRAASVAWVDSLTSPCPQSVSENDEDEDDRRLSVPIHDYTTENAPEISIDESICNQFEDDEGNVVVGKFLASLENTGLQRNDLRLQNTMQELKALFKFEEINHRGKSDDFVGSIETLTLPKEIFKEAILNDIMIISTAFRNQLIIPKFDVFCQHIENIFLECLDVQDGHLFQNIKHLKMQDPNSWGVSICTIDGQRFSIGNTNVPVTLHACSKPLMYAIALNELGRNIVHKYVGLEPGFLTTEASDLVLDHKKRPHNPMINAGTIMIHGLLQKLWRGNEDASERFDSIQNYLSKMSGNEYVGFNNGVYLANKRSSDRNWALGHYMKEHKCFPEGINLNDCIDSYLQVCSLESTCEVLSIIASTLANGGICPINGERALKGDVVPDVLSLMHSCGMLHYSGKFSFRIGLPAKSSISGLIILVIPDVCGVALWSPLLNSSNNSARGLAFCEKLVQVFNFPLYINVPRRHTQPMSDSSKIDPVRKVGYTKGTNTMSLLFAAAEGDIQTIIRLHLSGVNMNLSDYDKRTALHIAAAEGHCEVVEFLLNQCGVNHLSFDRWGKTPEDEARLFGFPHIATLLHSWKPEFSRVATAAKLVL